MTKELIRIATRGSMLALQQSGIIKAALEKLWPEIRFELQIIKTTGDKITDVPLAKVGGKGLFVKEIEDALADGSADMAVHSMKDVPAVLPAGLEIVAIPEREDPRDALIIREGKTIGDLCYGAVIGTSSLRRGAQIRAMRSDFEVRNLRGNLDTRLRKLDEGAIRRNRACCGRSQANGLAGQGYDVYGPCGVHTCHRAGCSGNRGEVRQTTGCATFLRLSTTPRPPSPFERNAAC